MEAADLAGDGRTFKVEFTSGGVAELRARVREKLGEFMGDAEDTLVEYVIVLLRNGRRKDEASKELHVFLGDDSAEFISWLWDHLSLNLHLYVQSQECDQEIKNNEVPKEVSGRQKPSEAHLRSNVQTNPEHTSESSKASRGRNKREWKGIVREGNETFPLRNVITGILHGEEKKVQKSNEIRHLPLSNQRNGRKRDREDEQQQPKRDLSSYPMVGASRRLLQSAVRDAVKTVQQTSSSTEPSSKRLRSVVSTTSAETMHDKRSQRTRRVLQVSGAALALKAAAEAAADSTKVRYSGSVFSRLGPGNSANQPSGFCDELRDHEEFEAVKTIDDHDDEIPEDLTIVDKETEMNVDSASDNDVDRDDGSSRYQSSDSHASTFLSIVDNKASLVKFNVAPETDMVQISRLTDEEPSTIRASRLSDEEQSASCLPTTSKIVSMPANANTLELSKYETPKDVHVVEKTDITTMKPNISIPSQGTPVAEIMKDLGPADVQKDSQRSSTTVASSYSTAHPTEDADSRTLYVSNVHFAATKDSLSRHFNKFGAVLKVVIVSNAATGQPTGSAYVEFLHKESAERALSLNGTSFMTRILKVVRRSSHEAAHFYGWPGSGRSSLYARHGRMAYNPRGVLPGSSFRGGRVPMKAGARSLQWKREPSGADLTAGTKPDMSVSLSSAEQVLPPPT